MVGLKGQEERAVSRTRRRVMWKGRVKLANMAPLEGAKGIHASNHCFLSSLLLG